MGSDCLAPALFSVEMLISSNFKSKTSKNSMTKKFIFLAAVVTVMSAVTLPAQESSAKAAEGTLKLETKSYELTKAVAFETTIDNEDAVSVVLSRKAVPGEKVKEARDN